MLKKENCKTHSWKSISFICSCKMKLCTHCVKDHYHEKMYFMPFQDFYLQFEEKLSNLQKIVDLYYDEIKFDSSRNKSTDFFFHLQNLDKIKLWIQKYLSSKDNLFKLTIEQIENFINEDITQKVIEMITKGLTCLVDDNQKKINEMVYGLCNKAQKNNSKLIN